MGADSVPDGGIEINQDAQTVDSGWKVGQQAALDKVGVSIHLNEFLERVTPAITVLTTAVDEEKWNLLVIPVTANNVEDHTVLDACVMSTVIIL